MFLGYQIRPTTQSSIHLSGRLPENAPIIEARFLEDDTDRNATARILDIARAVIAKGPLADYILDEEIPGPAVSTHEEALRYAIDAGAGVFHAVGANAMGSNDDDVVDPELRVRGVSGLRIVDASVLPVQVAGNTAAPTMAVGSIAADLILNGS
jgi:choline dehydrogenase-like flavoprotein